jgi:hypothetical protein
MLRKRLRNIIDQTLRVDLFMGMGTKPRRTLSLVGKK